jgi:hypothetical protein
MCSDYSSEFNTNNLKKISVTVDRKNQVSARNLVFRVLLFPSSWHKNFYFLKIILDFLLKILYCGIHFFEKNTTSIAQVLLGAILKS